MAQFNLLSIKMETARMSKTPIKNASYQTIGYIEELGGGKQKALDASYRTLGYYDPGSNSTKDASHRTIAKGNVLSGLIYDKR